MAPVPVAIEIATELCVPPDVDCANMADLANANAALKLEYQIVAAAAAGIDDPSLVEVSFDQTPCEIGGCGDRRGRRLDEGGSGKTDLITVLSFADLPVVVDQTLATNVGIAVEESADTISEATSEIAPGVETVEIKAPEVVPPPPPTAPPTEATIQPGRVRYLV